MLLPAKTGLVESAIVIAAMIASCFIVSSFSGYFDTTTTITV